VGHVQLGLGLGLGLGLARQLELELELERVDVVLGIVLVLVVIAILLEQPAHAPAPALVLGLLVIDAGYRDYSRLLVSCVGIAWRMRKRPLDMSLSHDATSHLDGDSYSHSNSHAHSHFLLPFSSFLVSLFVSLSLTHSPAYVLLNRE
jgi:hypothetical protein